MLLTLLLFSVTAGPVPEEKHDGKMFPKWMIAVIAGAGGLFLLVIVVIALCCFKRRRRKTSEGKEIPSVSFCRNAQPIR